MEQNLTRQNVDKGWRPDSTVVQVAPVALTTHSPQEHYQEGIRAISLKGPFLTQEMREEAPLCFQLTFTNPRFEDMLKQRAQKG